MHRSQALHLVSLGLGVLSAVLVVLNVGLLWANQTIEAEIASRQQYINQSAQLSRVNNALARALANSAENNKDGRLSELLAQQGITLAPEASTQSPTVGVPPQ